MDLPRSCAECGQPYLPLRREATCPTCTPARPLPPAIERAREQRRSRRPRRERGYGEAWAKLSARARRLQPWCSDCGSPDELTADHSTTAWARYEQGKPIRLADIDVVCSPCNASRGPARGPGASDRYRDRPELPELERPDLELDDEDLDARIARGEIDPDD